MARLRCGGGLERVGPGAVRHRRRQPPRLPAGGGQAEWLGLLALRQRRDLEGSLARLNVLRGAAPGEALEPAAWDPGQAPAIPPARVALGLVVVSALEVRKLVRNK